MPKKQKDEENLKNASESGEKVTKKKVKASAKTEGGGKTKAEKTKKTKAPTAEQIAETTAEVKDQDTKKKDNKKAKDTKAAKTKVSKPKSTSKKASKKKIKKSSKLAYKVSVISKAMTSDREKCLELYSKAVQSFNSGKLKDAESKFTELEKSFPTQIDIINHSSKYIERLKKHGKISLKKDDYFFHLYLADGYFNMCSYEKALEFWKKAIKINTEFADPYYSIAGTFSLLDKKTESLKYLAQAIQREKKCLDYSLSDPDFDNIRESGEFQELVEEAKQEISKMSKDIE